MNERIRKLALSNGIYDCICDPYDKFNTGDNYGSVMYDLERFAKVIIQDCIKIVHQKTDDSVKVATAIEIEFGLD